MNDFGKAGRPFVFLIDFEENKPVVLSLAEAESCLLWSTPGSKNYQAEAVAGLKKWEITPVDFNLYKKGFDLIQSRIRYGDSFLLNYTQPTVVETNLTLEEVFYACHSLYKVYYKDRFVCFSPEIFVRIKNGIISSFPMKGTIDAAIAGAEDILLNDMKEVAEHNTIVDLIRNDLSQVADDVAVERFRYISRIQTNRGGLLQVSSQISGILPGGYCEQIGDIIFRMLPAGSVSGAPKSKTIGIIRKAEGQPRGYYTGIFGYFDGLNLDSCVLIRYIEKCGGRLVFRSGGGITHLSNCESEYNELIQKVYVPVN